MRTVPAAVSELPGHHTATQGAFAETRHCSRAFMYLVKEMFAARSANSRTCPPSRTCISTICTGQPKEPPNVSRLQAKCAGGLAGQPNEPPNLSKINATHVSAKTKFYAAIPNRHFSCCSRFNAKILDLLSFSIFFYLFSRFLSSQNMLTIFGQKRYIYLPKHICSAYLGPKIDLLLSPNRAVYAFAPKIYLPLSPGRQPCRVSNTIPATLGRYLKPV